MRKTLNRQKKLLDLQQLLYKKSKLDLSQIQLKKIELEQKILDLKAMLNDAEICNLVGVDQIDKAIEKNKQNYSVVINQVNKNTTKYLQEKNKVKILTKNLGQIKKQADKYQQSKEGEENLTHSKIYIR